MCNISLGVATRHKIIQVYICVYVLNDRKLSLMAKSLFRDCDVSHNKFIHRFKGEQTGMEIMTKENTKFEGSLTCL
jgi:hypothetical protein